MFLKSSTLWEGNGAIESFRLVPLEDGIAQKPIRGTFNITCDDVKKGASSLRELVYNIANGKDAHITVTDGKGQADTYDVDLDSKRRVTHQFSFFFLLFIA